MDNCPESEQAKLFELERQQYNQDRFFSHPAGGGESIPMLCLRLRTDILEHLARECSDKRVIIVCHGHVMRALQLELEHLGHDDFIRLDTSKRPEDKIRNGQIIWYTRRDPKNGRVDSTRVVAVRSISPSENNDFGWRCIERRLFSNAELIKEAKRYPRLIR